MPTWKVTFVKKVVGVCHEYRGLTQVRRCPVSGLSFTCTQFTLALQRLSEQSQRWALMCSVYELDLRPAQSWLQK